MSSCARDLQDLPRGVARIRQLVGNVPTSAMLLETIKTELPTARFETNERTTVAKCFQARGPKR